MQLPLGCTDLQAVHQAVQLAGHSLAAGLRCSSRRQGIASLGLHRSIWLGGNVPAKP